MPERRLLPGIARPTFEIRLPGEEWYGKRHASLPVAS